ncbi:MAG TPA: glycosyltransferase [Vicinamibacterales bacterium]|nr:glycosyltransferase [Vicinamibacterales bacterium]
MADIAALLLRAKALATRDRFFGALEHPGKNSSMTGALVVSGWTFSRRAPIDRVEVFVDGALAARVPYGIHRPDVAAIFPALTDGRCGYFLRTWFDASVRGARQLEIRATDRQGNVRVYARAIDVRTPARAAAPARPRVDELLGLGADSMSMAILDWDGSLTAYDAGVHRVFTPPTAGSAIRNPQSAMPYVDHSVDIVALGTRDGARIAEAKRVARRSVVFVDGSSTQMLWSAEAAPARPSVSIVMPVHGHVWHTVACLERLEATTTHDVEIIVVDDASNDDTQTICRAGLHGRPLKVLRNETNAGFGESCNRGARAATGDVVVFLNNDTLPERGWLAPLLESLADPRVGAAGSKLIYPDGTLQEAGGVVFSDGSGWNFGHGDGNPDAPLFNHVRDVDYCSAAALATRRKLFLDLGGFDARYSPAYYEDTDYCFALRAAGYRIVYQPASVVVHVGGGTAGTDERSGVKSTQTRNRFVFAGKWRDALTDRPQPVDRVTPEALHRVAVRERATRRALVCAPKAAAFDRESGSKRVFDTICFLRDAGWAVTFVAECADGDEAYRPLLQQMGVAVYSGSETAARRPDALVDAAALAASGGFDLAILHFWWVGERYLPLIRRHSPRTRVLVDSVDLHFLRQARRLYGRRDAGNRVDVLDARFAGEMTRELNTYAAADGVLTVSQREADIVNEYFGRSDLAIAVPDAEELPQSTVGFRDRRGLLFLGNFRHTPNVDALGFLTHDIIPRLPARVLERHPISIVGNELTADVIRANGAMRDGVRLIGWVPDVAPYLERACVTLLPLRHGAGTKRKLIQAAMTGTPSVSTGIGVEGLPLRDDEHVLVADDPAAFAERIVRLVDDEPLWTRLADAGRRAAVAAHGRGVVRARFNEIVAP